MRFFATFNRLINNPQMLNKKVFINGQKVFWIFDDYSAILKNCLLVYASFKFGTSLVNATKSDFKTVNYVSAKATTQF